jgi:hypothetical protein
MISIQSMPPTLPARAGASESYRAARAVSDHQASYGTLPQAGTGAFDLRMHAPSWHRRARRPTDEG